MKDKEQTKEEDNCKVKRCIEEAKKQGVKNPIVSILCDCPKCRRVC